MCPSMPEAAPAKKPKPRRTSERPPEALAPQHEAFARDIADGLSAVASYRKNVASPGTTTDSCQAEGCQLLAVPEIKTRVEQLRTSFRKVLEERLAFRQESMARYLVDILETPIGEVNADHRLCQEHSRIDSEKSSSERFKMVSKAEAAKILNAMAGWNAPEKKEVSINTHEAVQRAMEKMFGEVSEE